MIDRVAPKSAIVKYKNSILFFNIGLLLRFWRFLPFRLSVTPAPGDLAELWRAFCHFAVKP